ncbi:M10 family metallopeptidase C-terminal domain-containing protein (plasmid) [Paracoccus sp. TK19116]|uniref:M10 family metallopeptidase C-terminal domain-containing protein n=1 Tax=Paracoccus albicereus TaxID=2922394 RepID=A0ABT1MNV7_9RHOB|nr:M10 family metallopeptidase [Paracoccus albicereus]MCQ0969123.1 M10 family metallopeptidase C-terminal domain-containing protein [Paracoccus albicereus]
MAIASTARVADYLTTGFWQDVGMTAPFWRIGAGDTLNVSNTLPGVEGTLARIALEAWTSVSGIQFRTVANEAAAQITLNKEGSSSHADFQYRADGSLIRSDVTMASNWSLYYGSTLDSYYMQTLVHELGHALGLGHAGPYNGQATWGIDNFYDNDSWQMSVMSYFAPTQAPAVRASYGWAITPMPADIVAIHQLYGKPTGVNDGATTYGWNSNAGGIHGYIGRALTAGTLKDPIMMTIYDQGGIDTLDLSRDRFDQRISLAAQSFSDVLGQTGNLGIAYETVIENVRAGLGHDTVIGNIVANSLSGGVGNDRLFGGGGHDTLLGDDGNDLLSGDAGNDLLIGSLGNDRMMGGAGRDTLSGGAGNDSMAGGTDADRLNGHDGADLIDGQEGSDTLIGGAGNDTLSGGAGNDLINGGSGLNLLAGNHGNDTIIGAGDRDRVFSGVGDDRMVLYGGNDVGYGGTGNDRLNGGNGADTLRGEDGNDTLYGGLHNDLLLGGAGNDSLMGDRHDDRLDGGIGDDWLSGGWENDRLWGRAGADTVNGGRGNDTLDGGGDADLLIGGGGADRFIFRAASDSRMAAPDTIADFQRGTDRMDFTAMELTWCGQTAFSGEDRAELRYETEGADLFVLADANGDGTANLRLCLSDVDAITAQDFLL